MNPLWKLVKNRPYELLTAAVILVFFLIKLHDVNIPYYWDEMGVYVPAAFHMKDAGHISLLPGSLESLFSRGHPLLFTFCNALVFKIFGDTITVGHLFALFLGIATLLLFFLIAKNLFNRKVAFFATVLLSAQPIFFTLSVQILPEMMLTFFTIASIYGILKKSGPSMPSAAPWPCLPKNRPSSSHSPSSSSWPSSLPTSTISSPATSSMSSRSLCWAAPTQPS